MIPGSEDPPPDLDTNELFGAGFEGLLESINEIGNEAGKLVDAAPLDIFNLDNMAEDEEKKRIAEENAQEDDEVEEVEEVVHHDGEDMIQKTGDNKANDESWDWSTPEKDGETSKSVTYVNAQVEEVNNRKHDKKVKQGKKKTKTSNTKKELDFFGFGGNADDQESADSVATSLAPLREGDLTQAVDPPIASPQFEPPGKRLEKEEEEGEKEGEGEGEGEERDEGNEEGIIDKAGGLAMDLGVTDALGITSDSLSSLLSQRFVTGIGIGTDKISSFFDTEADEDIGAIESGQEQKGDPLLEQVQRNKAGLSSPSGSAKARSSGEIMAHIRSFDTQAAFQKYHGSRDQLHRSNLSREGRDEESGISGVSGGSAPKAHTNGPMREMARISGHRWAFTSIIYRILSMALLVIWALFAFLVNLVLLGIKSEYRLPLSLPMCNSLREEAHSCLGGASNVLLARRGGNPSAGGASNNSHSDNSQYYNDLIRDWGVTCVNKTWSVLVTPTGGSLAVFSLLLLSYVKIRTFLNEMG